MNQQDASVKKLYRSKQSRVIAGVCGGIAEYFNIDPVWVRIGWVLSIFLKGLGLVAYLLCWIIMPEREETTLPQDTTATQPGRAATTEDRITQAKDKVLTMAGSQPRATLGVIIIVLGCIFALSAFVPFVSGRLFWAFVLIVLGLALIAKR